MTSKSWKLVIASSATRSLNRLPTKIALAIVEFMLGPLTTDPYRVGHPLKRDLYGLWSARRGVYRIIYELNESDLVINVLYIDHRADIYRPR